MSGAGMGGGTQADLREPATSRLDASATGANPAPSGLTRSSPAASIPKASNGRAASGVAPNPGAASTGAPAQGAGQAAGQAASGRAAQRGATPLGADAADLAQVERLVRAAGTSFYRGMRVLPPDRRAAMYAIYAFCRIVDDIADDDGPFADKLARLGRWRARIEALAAGVADGPVTRVLVLARRAFALREADFLAVIDGMQSDCEAVIVAPSLPELDLYCDRVAAAVGRLSVRAFGDASAAADEVAFSLGRALQLTNILRDVAEDAQRGRLYLAAEWLDAEGVAREPQAALASPALSKVCARGGALAREHFTRAQAAMLRCDRRAMRPARLMGATYGAILRRLERRGWPLARVSLPLWQKLLIAVRFGVFG